MHMKINSQTWNFQNSYIELPANLYIKQLPISVKNPQIIYINKGLAKELGLGFLCKNESMVADSTVPVTFKSPSTSSSWLKSRLRVKSGSRYFILDT